jgi:glutathione synthase/RimK-type ligase-like ATP-grasp enzyme
MLTFLRRRKLGLTSVREISNFMKKESSFVRNDKLEDFNMENTKFLVRWGCTSNSGVSKGTATLNKSEAIQRVSDKLEFRKLLNEHKLCPFTFFDIESAVYPCIIRPRTHSQGRNLFLAETKEELLEIISKLDEWYGSELIKKSREFRVFVGSGRVIWVANKIPADPDAIAWNVAQGGKFENVRFDEWHLRSIKIAIEGWKLSGLDFGGVDVIVDENNKAYIVEINSAPSQTSPYRQQCCAKYFDYIVENGKETIGLISSLGGWKKFIHPAISEAAILP